AETLLLCDAVGDHAALPAFPTRRSSDLAGRTRQGRARTMAALSVRGCRGAGPAASAPAGRNRVSCPADHRPRTVSSGPVALRTRDRKSTRLNSSHLVIPYAVFRLKNKES